MTTGNTGSNPGTSWWDKLVAPATVIGTAITVLTFFFDRRIGAIIFFLLTFVGLWIWLYPRVIQKGTTFALIVSLVTIGLALFIGAVYTLNTTSPSPSIDTASTSLALQSTIAAFQTQRTDIDQTITAAVPPVNLQLTNTALQSTITVLQTQKIEAEKTATAAISPATVLNPNTVPPAITAVTQVVVTQIVATSPPNIVTATPLPPTITPEIQPLNVGDTWVQDGLELKLVRVVSQPWGIYLYWDLKNNTDKTLSINYNLKNFNIKDVISGEQLNVVGYKKDDGSGGCTVNEVKTFLNAGDSIGTPCEFPMYVEVDLIDVKYREIIVTVSDISRITSAQWKIEIDLR